MTARAQRLRLQAMASALGVHIGRRIAQARREEGLETQQALADLLPSPINNQYVSKWEGGVKPKEETLELIAKALHRPTSWFFEGFQKKETETPDPFEAARGEKAILERLDRIERQQAEITAALARLVPTEDAAELVTPETAAKMFKMMEQFQQQFQDWSERMTRDQVGKRELDRQKRQDARAKDHQERPGAAAA